MWKVSHFKKISPEMYMKSRVLVGCQQSKGDYRYVAFA